MIDEFVKRAQRRHSQKVDDMVRRGLREWVSEIEPVIMYRVGEIVPFGIGVKNNPTPVIFLVDT